MKFGNEQLVQFYRSHNKQQDRNLFANKDKKQWRLDKVILYITKAVPSSSCLFIISNLAYMESITTGNKIAFDFNSATLENGLLVCTWEAAYPECQAELMRLKNKLEYDWEMFKACLEKYYRKLYMENGVGVW